MSIHDVYSVIKFKNINLLYDEIDLVGGCFDVV